MKNKRLWLAAGIGTGLFGYAALRRRLHELKQERSRWEQQQISDLEVLACPTCHGSLDHIDSQVSQAYLCPACRKDYPVVDGIPQFIAVKELSGWNKSFSGLYDWFSWGYRAFSVAAFAYIGMKEEEARREITDRLAPGGGRVLEVSIGPGVNLPYLVGRTDVGDIYGLDISPGQLHRCRDYAAHRGWPTRLQLGNAEQLPYHDNTFSGVFHIGGINFFNDKQKAIEEMVRVAKPGARILIADETEKGAKAYERFLPSFKKTTGERLPVVPPIDLVPSGMKDLQLFDIWKGWLYCMEFTKP
jgi:ubiquinone/menaquinone biosynthesis C-methylase UbiE/uncharacterized protein YbaR (Trm112 family)